MAGDEDSRVEAIRKRTKAPITHPDRVLYPALGLTKLDVIEYYLGVAPFLLPYLRGRPITMHRFPAGVGGNRGSTRRTHRQQDRGPAHHGPRGDHDAPSPTSAFSITMR